ncbi:MAG TPA: DUF692 domain-containing protein, partial [Gammaproteobacteria bacterium]|nr:DUF692 domain-containing protein [Gammaproteobacteria bacterium]
MSPTQQSSTKWCRNPLSGVGLGLRTPHYEFVEQHQPDIPWFEVLIDNYLVDGGEPIQHLTRVRENYPITFHGVGMSLGSTDPLNMDYLKSLRDMIERFEPAQVSDHLAWVSTQQTYMHELLPLPFTEEAIKHVSNRIQQVQDFLGQRILVENVSSYMQFRDSDCSEWDFLNEIVQRADCNLLLDINNIYVSAENHQFNAQDYLDAIPVSRVREMHLAGYEDRGTYLLDSHSRPVHQPVWELYKQALQRVGPAPTLIEWDQNIPDFNVLLEEAGHADAIARDILDKPDEQFTNPTAADIVS